MGLSSLQGHIKSTAYKQDPTQTSKYCWYETRDSLCTELNAETSVEVVQPFNSRWSPAQNVSDYIDANRLYPTGRCLVIHKSKTSNPISTTFWHASCIRKLTQGLIDCLLFLSKTMPSLAAELDSSDNLSYPRLSPFPPICLLHGIHTTIIPCCSHHSTKYEHILWRFLLYEGGWHYGTL